MNWPAILKPQVSGKATPDLCDYARTCAGFSWEQAREELDGLPDRRGLNIASQDSQWKTYASPAEGSRIGFARRRHFQVGDELRNASRWSDSPT